MAPDKWVRLIRGRIQHIGSLALASSLPQLAFPELTCPQPGIPWLPRFREDNPDLDLRFGSARRDCLSFELLANRFAGYLTNCELWRVTFRLARG